MKKNVCVIGNLNIDLIMSGLEGPPRWGREKTVRNFTVQTAGQVGYISKALAALQINTNVIANLGDDYYGHFILKDLKNSNINTEGINILEKTSTGITVALTNKEGERALISYPGSMENFSVNDIKANWDLIEKADYVVLNGYFLLPGLDSDELTALFSQIKKDGKRTILDTGWDPAGWPSSHIQEVRRLLPSIDIFLPNLDESKALTSNSALEKTLKDLANCGPSLVVIKLGEKGSIAYCKGDSVNYHQGFEVKTRNTTGAGDVFNGGLIYSLINGWDIRSGLEFANAFACMYILQNGGKYPDVREVQEFLENKDQEKIHQRIKVENG